MIFTRSVFKLPMLHPIRPVPKLPPREGIHPTGGFLGGFPAGRPSVKNTAFFVAHRGNMDEARDFFRNLSKQNLIKIIKIIKIQT